MVWSGTDGEGNGEWAAKFLRADYGTVDVPAAAIAPSGVAGQFRAMSAVRGVVGAFGAQYQAPAN